MSDAQPFERVPLREALRLLKDGTHGTHERVHQGVPLLSAKNIGENGHVTWSSQDDLITEADFRLLFHPQKGDVLLTIVGSLGRSAIHDGARVAFQRSVAFLRPNPSRSTPSYLYYALGSQEFQRDLASRSNATAQAGVYLGQIAGISLPLPSLAEQECITNLLSYLDTAVERTEQLVAKLMLVKRGLLQHLLTRGIDDNGELRDPDRYPEQFQDSPLGRIPRCWRNAVAGSEFEITNGLSLGPHRQFGGSPRPYLRVANVFRGYLDLREIAHMNVKPTEGLGRTLEAGDLLVVEGHANPNEIGRCAMCSDAVMGMTFQNHLFRLRPRRVRSKFALHWMNSELVQAYWQARCASSSGLYTINRTQLAAVPVLVPPDCEQKQISAITTAVEEQLYSEELSFAKLRLLKQALMDDLLTGRVRVTPLIEGNL